MTRRAGRGRRAGRSSARAVGARDGATRPRAHREIDEDGKPLEDARLVIHLGRLHANLWGGEGAVVSTCMHGWSHLARSAARAPDEGGNHLNG